MNDSIKETIVNCVILIAGACIGAIAFAITLKIIEAYIF